MRKFSVRLIFIAFVSILQSQPALAVSPPHDLLEAMEICDEADLRPIEGIWNYPDDDVTVLIFRDEAIPGKYGMYVVESADCSLNAADQLGSLTVTPDAGKFHLSMFTAVKKGILSAPCEATARLNSDGDAIIVTKPSLKFSFRPNRLLPMFWRMVNVNLKNAEKAPDGLIRIYPSYDGNNSSRRAPRYL